MKRILLLSGLLIILFTACKKQSFNDTRQATIDELKIQAYIKANHIDGLTKDPSGLYYRITTPAPGPKVTLTDTIQAQYTGTLLNGTVFFSKAVSLVEMPDAIKGWQIALPLIGVGGNGTTIPFSRLRLIVPSALAYADTGSTDGTVPPNQVLDFTIDLIGFYN